MQIKFNPALDYQAEALSSIVALLEGQARAPAGSGEHVVRNRLTLDDDALLTNLRRVQLRNGLPPSRALQRDALDYTVEMETGTGKTYVYLRGVYELHRRYGLRKFIVVVPSIAIREGVHKTVTLTEDHFRSLYDGARARAFVYDARRPGAVREFATSGGLQLMIITIDAFRRGRGGAARANVIHRPHDQLAGASPIELIRGTRPIVIIDEPQRVDTTARSARALASLRPLLTLRFSATHRDLHHPIYRLDAVDAHERGLVKQIEVATVTSADDHARGRVRLLGVDNRRGLAARLELDVLGAGGQLRRATRTVRPGADLRALSGGRAAYRGYVVEDICCAPGRERVRLGLGLAVDLGRTIGGLDPARRARLLIRKTVEEHLEKELRLRPRGIKVLSLLFLDRVANYRGYDDAGNPVPGPYARVFEEEYARAVAAPRYRALRGDSDGASALAGVHDGYFARDRRRRDARGDARLQDSRGAGVTAADEDAYRLIMRDKEKLLSFASRLRFIFTHSALREGWDNPNVFQICTLGDSRSTVKKRQELGRGLRLAVNQGGERVYGPEVNTLTVMANESYEAFARALQRELEDDGGVRFGVVARDLFADLPTLDARGEPTPLGVETSTAIWRHLRDEGYLDARGGITDALRDALQTRALALPAAQAALATMIQARLRRAAGALNLRRATRPVTIRPHRERAESPAFKALWDRVKHRSSYRVAFDPEAVITACAAAIRASPAPAPARLLVHTRALTVGRRGVTAGARIERVEHLEGAERPARIEHGRDEPLEPVARGGRIAGDGHVQPVQPVQPAEPLRRVEHPERAEPLERVEHSERDEPLERDERDALLEPPVDPRPPDIVSALERDTGLTRRSIVAILRRCGRLSDLRRSPDAFLRQVSTIIKRELSRQIARGIAYRRRDDGACFERARLLREPRLGYPGINMLAVSRSIYTHVVYRSTRERAALEQLERCPAVRVHVGLPAWFVIDTPLGTYHPDWAALLEPAAGRPVAVVLELRRGRDTARSQARRACARAHFRALAETVALTVVDDPDALAERLAELAGARGPVA